MNAMPVAAVMPLHTAAEAAVFTSRWVGLVVRCLFPRRLILDLAFRGLEISVRFDGIGDFVSL